MLEIDLFYLKMFLSCGTDFMSILAYCKIHNMDDFELLESIDILREISGKVK